MHTRALHPRNKQFTRAFGGYSPAAVRAALCAVADDYDAALDAVAQLRAEHAGVLGQLLEAQAREREATRVLSNAERDAQAIRGGAEARAADIVAAAERRASELLRDAGERRDAARAYPDACRDGRLRTVQALERELAHLRRIATGESTGIERERPGKAQAPVPVEPEIHCAAPQAAIPEAAATLDTAPLPATVLATLEHAQPPSPAGEALAAPAPAYLAAPGAPAELCAPVTDPAPMPQEAPAEDVPAYLAAPAGGIAWSDGDTERSRMRFVLPAAIAAGVVLCLVAIPRVDLAKGRSASAVPAVQAAGFVPSAPGDRATAVPRTAGTPSPAASPVPAPIPPGTLRLQLDAKAPCWIRLTSGARSESRLLEAGETITRDSTEPIALRAGDAGALVITVNGRVMPPLGRAGDIATRQYAPPAR